VYGRIVRLMADRVTRGQHVTLDEMLEEIRARDAIDSSRAVAPLRPADDAVLLDNSDLSIDETVELAAAILEKSQAVTPHV